MVTQNDQPPGLQYPDMSGMDPILAAAIKTILDNLFYLRGRVNDLQNQIDGM